MTHVANEFWAEIEVDLLQVFKAECLSPSQEPGPFRCTHPSMVALKAAREFLVDGANSEAQEWASRPTSDLPLHPI